MSKPLLSIVLAAMALFADPAQSATVNVTYSGIVQSGTDQTGEFGAAGTDLANAAYSLSVTYDTGRGQRFSDGVSYDQIFGGSWYLLSSPVVSAVLTINGNPLTFGGATYAMVSAMNYPAWYPGPALQMDAYYEHVDSAAGTSAFSYIFDTVVDVTAPAQLPVLDAPSGLTNTYGAPLGGFTYHVSDIATGASRQLVWGTLFASGVTVTPAPVPLPAAAGLLLLALGSCGVVARRRRAA